MNSPRLPELRQIVLMTGDLERSLKIARDKLGVPRGLRDPEDMEKLGMVHEVVGFDRTFIEILEPTDPESGMGRRAAKGDCGFMLVMQVEDSPAMLERAEGLGIKPLFLVDHHGNQVTQWHPRDMGTIAELDQMIPVDGWHFAPAIYDARSTEVAQDLCAVELSVENPDEMAARWATITGAPLNPDGRSIDAGGKTIRFVAADGVLGFHRVEYRATDRARVGESFELAGVTFTLV